MSHRKWKTCVIAISFVTILCYLMTDVLRVKEITIQEIGDHQEAEADAGDAYQVTSVPTGNKHVLDNDNSQDDRPDLSVPQTPETVTPGTTSTIPHRIHQIWNNHKVPKMFVPWMQSWRHFHPDWEYWFWTDNESNLLMEQHIPPSVKSTFDKITDPTFKADILKFAILHQFGGVYTDLDMECLKPLDIWTDNHQCVISEENLEHPMIYYSHKEQRGKLMATILMCESNHPFYSALLDGLIGLSSIKDVYTENIYRQYDLHANTTTGTKAMHVETNSTFFFPTFDPMLAAQIKGKCINKGTYRSLSRKLQMACDHNIQSNFANKPSAESYTNHYWVHLNYNSPRAAQIPHVDVHDALEEMNNVNILKRLHEI